MVVDKKNGRRRQGHGSKMMVAAEKWSFAQGCKRLYLEYMDEVSRKFYASLGYEPANTKNEKMLFRELDYRK